MAKKKKKTEENSKPVTKRDQSLEPVANCDHLRINQTIGYVING